MAPLPTVLVAVMSVAVLTSCAGPSDDVTTPATVEPTADVGSGVEAPPSPTSGATDRAEGNAEALAFTAPDLGGGTFDASDYVGRDVILWMWAPW